MNELVWALMGFTFGSLIFSFFLRKEKIGTVIVLLTVIWMLTFLIEFVIYLSAVTPPVPPEINFFGAGALFFMLILFISEFFKKGGNNRK